MMWSWIPSNWSLIWQLIRANAYLGVVSPLIGLVISVPLGIVAARWRWFWPPVLVIVNVVYAIPALALFIALIPAYGLTNTPVVIALTAYSLCIILPNVVAGLRAVPAPVRQAATAMGYGPLRRLITVELPLAVPVIIAGLQRSFPTEIFVGLFLIIALALICDLILVGLRRALTPWAATRSRAIPPWLSTRPRAFTRAAARSQA
jgi:osmoprotectant transport system permease protein